MEQTRQNSTPRPFDRGARLALIGALLLLLVDIGQVAYRFTLPTEGWSVHETGSFDQPAYVFYSNLVGAPSGLQRDDILLAVDGVESAGDATMGFIAPPPGWRIGKTVEMRIRRGDTELSLPVPVVGWTAGALWRYQLDDIGQLFSTLGDMALLVIGGFTFWQRPDVPSARALLIFCTAVGAATISRLVPESFSYQTDLLSWLLTSFYSFAIIGTVLAPSLLAFSLLFPHPKAMIQRHPWLGYSPFAVGLVVLGFLLAGVIVAGWLATMVMLLGSIASLIHAGLTRRDAASRAQLRWAISGFVLGLGLFLLNFPAAFGWVTRPALIDGFDAMASLSSLVIGSCLAIAVLRYRLYDIDVIIRRTLQYTAITAILALTYFGSVVLLQTLFERLTGEESPLAIVVSTLAIAALFIPLRKRVQAAVDRRFFRQKYDAQQVLSGFAATARDETNLDRLQNALVGVIETAVAPAQVGLWLKGEANGGERQEEQPV